MNLPQIEIIKYTLDDLRTIENFKDEGILKLRTMIDILVIDDEVFEPGDFLTKNNFRLTYKNNIDNVRDVSEYPIIMCDIRGVGKELNEEYQGAYLIKEIKTSYPDKTVIAYTASQYDATYNKFLSYADELLTKGLALEDWVSILDVNLKKMIDPMYQWCDVRNKLFDKGLSTIKVAKLESDYVEACKKKDFKVFEKNTKNMESEIRSIIIEFLSSSTVKWIKGAI
ncbi:MAG: hypothetical protein J6A59_12660 [Lachnospiraceae bacterium]|nr:hypothetical protein [Lachnospiraceae bacterium]